jgi:glycosyltransferase involved in cell wall biosynthesis
MRIGVDIRCLSEGRRSGVEEYVEETLKSILSMDSYNEYVFFLNAFSEVKADLSWVNQYPNVSIRRWKIPNKILNFFLWYFKWPKIDRLIGGADVFFAPNINFLALSKHTKLVLTVHDLSFELYPETFSWKRRVWHFFIAPRALCRYADRIVAVSNSTAQDLITRYGISREKISVIYSGVGEQYVTIDRNNPILLSTKEKYHLPYRFVLFLGTWEPRKNINMVVSAYNAYRKNCPEDTSYHLVLAGTPGWKSCPIIEAVKKSPYQSSIHLLGFVENEDKPALYNLAEVFVYVSLYEGFGFPVLEAMRCGTPTITSHTSSLAEVTDGYAILVDPYKPDELYRVIRELFIDKELRKMCSESGRHKSYGYRWQLSGSALLEVFREVLGGTTNYK